MHENSLVERDKHITNIMADMQSAFDEAKAFQHFSEKEKDSKTTAMVETVAAQIEGVVAGVGIYVDDPFDLFPLHVAEKSAYVNLHHDWKLLNDQAFIKELDHVKALEKFVEKEIDLFLLSEESIGKSGFDTEIVAVRWELEAIKSFMDANR